MLLHELLASKRDDLMRRWTDRIGVAMDSLALTHAELADHVPAFIDEISLALRLRESPGESTTAASHGTQRLRLGFDLNSVVREYGELRNCILALAHDEGVHPSDGELRVLFDCVITGIAEAVSEYARQRNAELQRQAAEHYAFIAHELRNPLQSSRTALYLLQRRGGIAAGPAAEALERGLSRIHDLVEHSLELARLGAGVELRRERVDLARLIRDVEAISTVDAEDKKVQIHVHLDGDPQIFVDVRLMQSAISNVVGNAIKFTQPGKAVHIRARVADNHATIEVEDECGGLAPGVIEKAFSPFVQHDATRGGFGLGLAIAKQAIDAHGGTIRVRDLPGQGCAFVMEVPSVVP